MCWPTLTIIKYTISISISTINSIKYAHLDEHPAIGAAEVQQVVGGSQVTLRLGHLIRITITITRRSISGSVCPMNYEIERELRELLEYLIQKDKD